ncbi:unnamed protein product [Rangifer tarandus platyrhynchus]|uniref:Uncharacterized protein n=2 Tax=Rangifer tarandus platyrhynchus TaxID=3082113 RepID=A0ACB0FK38_RANTA|nr:unnamed protein product [Rangifer tarandus platyrhynchus]CAI9713462.1 unnamed protein product [Rangifer tarandus platyrhynchus]
MFTFFSFQGHKRAHAASPQEELGEAEPAQFKNCFQTCTAREDFELRGLDPADGSRPWGVKRPSFGSASPGDTQWRRGPECRAAPSKSAGRGSRSPHPGPFSGDSVGPAISEPPPVGLSNGRSQRGAGLPGFAQKAHFSASGALWECARHMAPVHALTPTSDPGERSLSHGAAAPHQAGSAPPRPRLLRDTRRSAAGCRAPDGRDYDRERPGRWDCSSGRHGAEPFRSPQLAARSSRPGPGPEPPQMPSGQTWSSLPQFFQSLTLLLKS